MTEDKLTDLGVVDEGRVAFNDRFNGVLVHGFAKERHFVDEDVKDEAVASLITQLEDNSLKYVGNPVFAENLLRQKVEEFNQELQVRPQMGMEQAEDDDDGPADFPSCFQD
ncbi:MAG: hypothetical protein ABFS18_12455 [Thermodesulfobacteriota bacterium]